MQRKPSALLTLFLALLVCTILAADSVAQVTMPRLSYRDRTLPNGLRVLTAEDRSSPTVAIQVWYKVGGCCFFSGGEGSMSINRGLAG